MILIQFALYYNIMYCRLTVQCVLANLPSLPLCPHAYCICGGIFLSRELTSKALQILVGFSLCCIASLISKCLFLWIIYVENLPSLIIFERFHWERNITPYQSSLELRDEGHFWHFTSHYFISSRVHFRFFLFTLVSAGCSFLVSTGLYILNLLYFDVIFQWFLWIYLCFIVSIHYFGNNNNGNLYCVHCSMM